jgi:two-component system chemotaxis response regulator CheB
VKCRAIVIGVSAGGLRALQQILSVLPEDFPVPIAIVQHMAPDSNDYLSESLNRKCRIAVKQAEEKESLRPGTAYIAPANYHLMIERDLTFSLSIDARVNFARPAVDVLFETAAEAYGDTLLGVILTGANSDGARGLKKIKECGGMALVQDPLSAESSMMPEAALETAEVDMVAPLEEIGPLLVSLFTQVPCGQRRG